MSYLVDTNAWIFFLEDSPKLSDAAADIIEDNLTICCISIASIWEAAIKVGQGKLKLAYDLESDLPRILEENGFSILPIEYRDAVMVRSPAPIHGDPFDRIQAVQSQNRNCTILSRDPVFDSYGLKRIW